MLATILEITFSVLSLHFSYLFSYYLYFAEVGLKNKLFIFLKKICSSLKSLLEEHRPFMLEAQKNSHY